MSSYCVDIEYKDLLPIRFVCKQNGYRMDTKKAVPTEETLKIMTRFLWSEIIYPEKNAFIHGDPTSLSSSYTILSFFLPKTWESNILCQLNVHQVKSLDTFSFGPCFQSPHYSAQKHNVHVLVMLPQDFNQYVIGFFFMSVSSECKALHEALRSCLSFDVFWMPPHEPLLCSQYVPSCSPSRRGEKKDQRTDKEDGWCGTINGLSQLFWKSLGIKKNSK